MYITKFLGRRRAVLTLVLLVALGVADAQNAPSGSVATAKSDAKFVLSGTITDASTGKGLVGISVSVEGFSAAITDENGHFNLNVPSWNVDVMVSGDGYESRQIALKGRKSLQVALLDESYQSFQQVVTLPLGKAMLRNIPAAATKYDARGEWGRPDETIDAILQGQVAGLNSIRRSGTPGVGANLFLRGYNSLYATNKPLVVVDGMLYDNNDYGESIIASNYTNPLALINVQDIDNVTILKDASTIYGTKGANGAILITTARAREQATRIDFGAFTGITQAPDRLPVMNTYNYRIYLSELLQSKGLSASDIASLPYMNDDPLNADYYRYHNNTSWQKNVMEAGVNNNYFLKVTGGDNIATYALSVGYLKNKGIIKETDLSRYNTRFNAEFNFSKRFTGSANLSFTYNEQNLKDQGIADKTAPVFVALTKAPFLTDHEVNEKGILSPNLEDADILGVSNPSVLIQNMQAFNKYYRFFGSFGFNYSISSSLSASTLFGVVYDKVRENIFVPRKGVADDTLSNAIADSRLGSQVKRLFTFYTDSKLELKKSFGWNHFVSRLGVRYQHNSSEQDFALGFNSATDELVSVQNGINALRQIGGGIGKWNWMNTYFNVDYDYRNKLFLAFNAAIDGSSRFGPAGKGGIGIGEVRYALMPSVSAAWLISSENFMAHSVLDLLKLRASLSVAGNDDIGNYSSRQTYTFQNLLGMQGMVREGVPNPAIQWETCKRMNVGLDVSTWNERLGFSLDLYRSRTTNMLVFYPIPGPTGFEYLAANSGGMRNTGLEASVNVRVINKRDLKWDLSGNVSTYKNEILNVPNDEFTTEFAGATILTREGAAANQFFGYKANGVFSTSAEAAAANLRTKNADGSFSTFAAGDIHFADLNGDHIIDENDRKVIGNPNPRLFGGFNSRLAYKRFELSLLFTFSSGNDIYNYQRHRLEAASGVENQLNSVINRWKAEGHVTDIPRATWGDPLGNSRFSDRWIEDGSYLRLRTATINYRVPISSAFVKYATVYVTGNNLLTFTKYMGYDPEFSANPTVFAQGIDTGLDPLYRSVTAGIRIGL